DTIALVGYSQRVVYLNDHQMCVLTSEDWKVLDVDSQQVSAQVHHLDWDTTDVDKGDHEHFMLKEIFEQPEVLERAMAGRLNIEEGSAHFGGLNLSYAELRQVDRIVLT